MRIALCSARSGRTPRIRRETPADAERKVLPLVFVPAYELMLRSREFLVTGLERGIVDRSTLGARLLLAPRIVGQAAQDS